MFTPHRVAGGPDPGVTIKKIRITDCIFIRNKNQFQVIDNYHINANAHRMLGEAWAGTTEFREVDDYIEDVDKNKKSIVWADCSSDGGDRLRGPIMSISAVGPTSKSASAHSRRPVTKQQKLSTRIHEMKSAQSVRPSISERAHKSVSGGRHVIHFRAWQRRDWVELLFSPTPKPQPARV